MTQPKFAPIARESEVRPLARLAPPAPWRPHRPAETRPGPAAHQRRGGVPGPDQGYALRLARRFAERLVLAPGEHADDVLAGAVAIALKRAARYGRAPVGSDIECALELFGFLGGAPGELVAFRTPRFSGVHHDDWALRALTDLVPADALACSPAEAHAGLARWRERLAAD